MEADKDETPVGVAADVTKSTSAEAKRRASVETYYTRQDLRTE